MLNSNSFAVTDSLPTVLIAMASVVFIILFVVLRRKLLASKNTKRKTTIKNMYATNKTLRKETEQLNQANKLLEERQHYIEEQAEELNAQKDQLEELNRMKDKFFSIIAHDLKNPFHNLLGLTELLKLKHNTYEPEKREQVINEIFNSSKYIYQLLNNLLEWSRSQRGAIEFKPVKTSIRNIIAENIRLLKVQAKNKNITINTHIENHDHEVFADVNLLDTVLRNLLSNAIKFTDINGKIDISVTQKEGYDVITVSDSGVGMSADDVQKLFRLDKQFSKPGTNEEQGTGLGLIICKEFVEKHSGFIDVESTEGKGTRFIVSIPIAP